MKTTGMATLVLAVAVRGFGARRLQAQAPRGPSDNRFAGKIVEIKFRSGPDHSEILKDVEVRLIGDRSFLVGTNVEENLFRTGTASWVAIDDASLITEYSSLEDRKNRIQAWAANHPAR